MSLLLDGEQDRPASSLDGVDASTGATAVSEDGEAADGDAKRRKIIVTDAPLSTQQSEALDRLIAEVFAAYTEGFEPIFRNVVLADDFGQTATLMINAVCES